MIEELAHGKGDVWLGLDLGTGKGPAGLVDDDGPIASLNQDGVIGLCDVPSRILGPTGLARLDQGIDLGAVLALVVS
jgi:hypothetical protein